MSARAIRREVQVPVEIHLMSGYAPKEVFVRLAPQFEKQTGHKPIVHYAVLSAIREKLAAGERPDIIVMPVPLIDGYVTQGLARADARATLGIVGTGVVIRKGAKAPDISSRDGFRQALLDAGALTHAPPTATPSGAYCAKMMQQLGIADIMAKKIIHRPALEGGLQLVASGEAEFGIFPKSEIVNVEGLKVVGLLPPGLQFNNVYGAAAVAGSAAAEPAAAFVRYLADPANRQVWTKAGFDPPESA